MSIILDALKKSEAERQQSGAPGLYEARLAPPRSRFPLWLAIVCALLVINAAGLAWVLLRGHDSVTRPPAATAAPPMAAQPAPVQPVPQPAPYAAAATAGSLPAAPPAAASPDSVAPTTSDAPDADENEDDTPAVAPARTARPAAATAAPETGGSHVYRVAPDQPLPPGPPPPRGSVQSYQDAAANGGLPNLTINLYSWSKDPAQRYILLNMVRLKEGDTGPQGVKVEAITPDGAILSWQGREFMLQR